MTRTLAHVSDLHLGRDARTDAAAASLVRSLLEAEFRSALGEAAERGVISVEPARRGETAAAPAADWAEM